MTLSLPRRRLLEVAATSIGGVVAGCQTRLSDTPTDHSSTPAPPASTTPAPSLSSTEPSNGPRLSSTDFDLEVTTLKGFTRDHPARLQITFRNTGNRTLVGSGGPKHILPFVDDDYAGTDQSGTPVLFLLPDGGPYFTVKTANGTEHRISDVVPDSSDTGCWPLQIDWPPESIIKTPVLHRIRVEPGDSMVHEYTLYHIETCDPGHVTFENSLEVTVDSKSTPTPDEQKDEYLVTLRVSVTGTGETIQSTVMTPTIREATSMTATLKTRN